MSEKIVQLNEEVIKGQIKELVRGSYVKAALKSGGIPTLWQFCDTSPALLRGKSKASSDMIQTRLIHDLNISKKEHNIP